MSDKSLARHAIAEVAFDGVDITSSIKPYFLSLTYTDSEDNEADDLQLKLHDRDGIWQESWLGKIIDAAASSADIAQSTPTTTPINRFRVNSKAGLNIRSGPGTSYSRCGGLAYGAEVEVIGTVNNWSKIAYNGQTAYVCADYLTEIDSSDVTADDQVKNAETTTGLKIQAVIATRNWDGNGDDKLLDCGQFELDSVDCSGPPAVILIRATALPFSSQIRQTKKSKAWEAYRLSGIADEIALNSGMACMYLAGSDPEYKRVEQYQMSDISFLSLLCHENGMSLKVINNILVLFDQVTSEDGKSVLTIRKGDGSYTSYKLRTGNADVNYATCRVYWTDSSGSLIEGVSRVEYYDEKNESNQQLEIRAKVDSIAHAETLAAKYLRLHNKYQKTASFTIPGNPLIGSGMSVDLEGWGPWNGAYIVSQAKHNLSNIYTTQIELRKVLEGY